MSNSQLGAARLLGIATIGAGVAAATRIVDEVERSLRLAGLQAERDRIFEPVRSQALSDAHH